MFNGVQLRANVDNHGAFLIPRRIKRIHAIQMPTQVSAAPTPLLLKICIFLWKRAMLKIRRVPSNLLTFFREKKNFPSS